MGKDLPALLVAIQFAREAGGAAVERVVHKDGALAVEQRDLAVVAQIAVTAKRHVQERHEALDARAGRAQLAEHGARRVNAVPEFEDCQAIARARNLSVKDVQAIALHAYGGQQPAPTTQS